MATAYYRGHAFFPSVMYGIPQGDLKKSFSECMSLFDSFRFSQFSSLITFLLVNRQSRRRSSSRSSSASHRQSLAIDDTSLMHKDGQTPRHQVEAIKQEFMAKFQEKLVAQNDPSLGSCDKSNDTRIQIPLGEWVCSTSNFPATTRCYLTNNVEKLWFPYLHWFALYFVLHECQTSGMTTPINSITMPLWN